MGVLVGIIAVIALLVMTVCYLICVTFIDILRVSFGYRKYSYSKILSYGIKEATQWHKTDEEALESYKDYEFVEIIKPFHKRLRPLK